jgi:CBS domain-containing protein
MLVEAMVPRARQRLLVIADGAQLIEAARLLRERDADIVAVCESSGRLAGVITKTDIVRQISHCQGAGSTVAAAAVMTPNPVVCHPDEWLRDAWASMKECRLKNLPIMDRDSRPFGMLNARDALEGLVQDVENEKALLLDYVMRVGYR